MSRELEEFAKIKVFRMMQADEQDIWESRRLPDADAVFILGRDLDVQLPENIDQNTQIEIFAPAVVAEGKYCLITTPSRTIDFEKVIKALSLKYRFALNLECHTDFSSIAIESLKFANEGTALTAVSTNQEHGWFLNDCLYSGYRPVAESKFANFMPRMVASNSFAVKYQSQIFRFDYNPFEGDFPAKITDAKKLVETKQKEFQAWCQTVGKSRVTLEKIEEGDVVKTIVERFGRLILTDKAAAHRCVDSFIARKESPEWINELGWNQATVLHQAVRQDLELAEKLIALGADLSIRGGKGNTPLDLLRLEHGADAVQKLQTAKDKQRYEKSFVSIVSGSRSRSVQSR